VAVDQGDVIQFHEITPQAVLKRLRTLATAAKVSRFSPHDCRRTFITTLIDSGVDLFAVARLSGHRQLRTLERYDRRGQEAAKRAVESIRIPFGGGQP